MPGWLRRSSDHYLHEPGNADLWYFTHVSGYGELRASGHVHFHHYLGLHRVGQKGDSCETRNLRSRCEPGWQQRLWSGPDGRACLGGCEEAQTITFTNPGAKKVGAVVPLGATASSGLAVSYSSTNTSVCTISGSNATMVATGTCGVDAKQAGNADYLAAPEAGHAWIVTAN